MNRDLWPHQSEALTALRQTVGQGIRRIVLQAPTGSGKTLLSAAIIESALAKGLQVAFVVDAISLVDQTVQALYREGITEVGVIQASHNLEDWSKPVQVVSIQTVAKRKAFPRAAVIIIDECVRAGTKISTLLGEKNIEDIRVGDCVFNAVGVGKVRAVSKRRKPILKLGLSNGRELGITHWHPIFGGTGWRHAGSVEKRARFFSQQAVSKLWENLSVQARCHREGMGSPTILFGGVRESRSAVMAPDAYDGSEDLRLLRGDFSSADWRERRDTRREVMEAAGLLLAVLCKEIEKPDARFECYRKIECHLEEYRAPAEDARWQWTRVDLAAADGLHWFRGGVGGRISGRDTDGPLFRVSELLQVGCSKPPIEDWDRGGWFQSRWEAPPIGSEEGSLFGDVGVESVSCEEQGRAVDVFNIEVSGHPSYFADGVLVHNCHVLHAEHKRLILEAKAAREAHLAAVRAAVAAGTEKPKDESPVIIGLSATPYTKGLGQYFETMIVVASTQEMIDKKVLSPFKVFATGHPDLSKVKTVAGDYHEGQLSDAMQVGSLSADIIHTYKKHWGKGKTLCFAVDCAHAQALQKRFQEAGIPCGYQDARTPTQSYDGLEGWVEGREEIKKKFHDGTYEVVTNVGTLTKGVDWDVRCLILARPTKSEMLYQQIIGRALRVAEGKEHAVILDHSDTTQRLGFVTDIFHESLNTGKENSKEVKKERLPKECPSCSMLKPVGVRKCPNCGFEPEIKSNIREDDGAELQEVVRGQIPKGDGKRQWSPGQQEHFYRELIRYCRENGYKDGWAANKYKERFGDWPPRRLKFSEPAYEISYETQNWIIHTQIKWARSQRRA